jgi:gliding motility-associated-like protein
VPYEIALIAPDGCSNNQQVTTTVDPTPTLTPPADASQTVCSGVLTEDIPLTGPVPGTVYTWTNSNIAIGLPASGTGDVPTFQAANPGTATIQVLATSPAGCIATAANAATFTIDPTQAPQVTTPIGTLLCSGDSIPIDAIGANTYQWYVNGMPIGNFDGSEYDAYTPGVYTVTAITAQGCRDSSAAPTTVSLIPKPQVSFSFPSPWCTGQPVTLLNTTTGTPPITFLWTDTFGDTSTTTSPTFTYPTAGNIIMTLVATPDGCATSAGQLSGTLQVVAPAPGIDLPPVNTEPGLPTVLQAPNLGDSIVVWSPPTGLSDPAIQDPTATLTAPQTYTITMVTFQGCTTTDTLLVRVIPKNVVLIPSAFTPNGDGINDLFVIAGLNNYPGSSLGVYDRWGKQVYYSASYQNNWDGGNQPVGTYVYVLQLKISGGYKIFKGTLVIMR